MLLPDVNRCPVGTVIKPHGIHGELNVAVESDLFPTSPGQPLIVEINGLDVPFFVAAVRSRGPESVLLSLDEIHSDAEAARLTGQTLYVYASASGEALTANFDEDELTADLLVGYTITDYGHHVGRIADVQELAADNWCFVLDDGRLIPVADDLILNIDHQERIVEMSLPAGLLDLN